MSAEQKSHRTVQWWQRSIVQFGVILFLLVLLIRAALGLTRLDFSQDVARDVVLAKQHLAEHDFVVGYGAKTSVANFRLPPLYYQIHVILTAVAPHNPAVMMWFVIVLESATPVIVWLLLREFLDTQYAACIAISYALFHLVLVFSTSGWNPNIIPVCTASMVYGWYSALSKRRRWGVYLGVIAPAVAANMHLQAFALLPLMLLGMCLTLLRRPRMRRDLLFAVLIALLMYVPYLWAETRHDWQNTHQAILFFTGEHAQYYDRVSKPAYVLTFLPAFYERLLVGQEQSFHWLGRLLFWGGGLCLTWLSIRRHRHRSINLWLLLYISTVVAAMRLYRGDKLDYYLLILLPSSSMLVAALTQVIPARARWLILLLLMWAVYRSGYLMGKIEPHNAVEQTQAMMSYIDSVIPDQTARYVFHDLQLVNLIAFGTTFFSAPRHALSARYLVDVCHTGDASCAWNDELRCSTQQIENVGLYLYLEKLHRNVGYQQLTAREFPGLATVVIGSVATSAGALSHPAYDATNLAGSDYLITQF